MDRSPIQGALPKFQHIQVNPVTETVKWGKFSNKDFLYLVSIKTVISVL
jgi:hypothetical protein